MNDITIIDIYPLNYYSTMAFPPSQSFMLNTHNEKEDHDHHHPSISLNTFPPLPPQHFQAGDGPFMLKRSMSFSGLENKCDGDDELSDDGLLFQYGGKKKRLNLEQVKALEKSFELGNKLEAERKVGLAKALGLQPRQISIWFQNRRARCKTKQLEKEYQLLKKQFQLVRSENDALKAHNHKLQAQLQALKSEDWCEAGTSLKKEVEGFLSINGSDNISDINLDLSRTLVLNSPVSVHQNCKSLLPTSLKPISTTQLSQDEGFCNMFHNIDEQDFWLWPDQQNHFH
ncbi:hypothetical protein RJT34_18254 [Clitoria ternatea]|uniref:Homeobox-leucine zipper protein n=1 Tax=Clitoria ternatea TaxID=43366 RepID=A0AAN9JAG1_CLITE